MSCLLCTVILSLLTSRRLAIGGTAQGRALTAGPALLGAVGVPHRDPVFALVHLKGEREGDVIDDGVRLHVEDPGGTLGGRLFQHLLQQRHLVPRPYLHRHDTQHVKNKL